MIEIDNIFKNDLYKEQLIFLFKTILEYSVWKNWNFFELQMGLYEFEPENVINYFEKYVKFLKYNKSNFC